MIKPESSLVPIDSIVYNRENRQRTTIDMDKVIELAEAIADHDLIHTPIVQMETNILASGEHRIEAFKYNRKHNVPCKWEAYNNWNYIPVRFGINITANDMKKIELLENVRRNDMTWQDNAKAIYDMHSILLEEDQGWTAQKTSKYLTIDVNTVSRALNVVPELIKDNKQVAEARGLSSAYKIIKRKKERAAGADLNGMNVAIKDSNKTISKPAKEITISDLGDLSGTSIEEEVHEQIVLPDAPEEQSAEIIQADFHEWARAYDGLPFNFIHCDFPYGINHQDSEQGYTTEWGEYLDFEDTYWELLETLIEFRSKLILPSSHIMFWHSADQNRLDKTKAFIRLHAPEWEIYPYYLIWHKSDNKGVLPDPQRSGRNTYEIALQITVGDRKINRAVSMSYAGPSRKSIHASEKPIPMLHHFFRMFVDEYSRVLDPTCGSGNSIRAAYDCKAESALGLELLESNAELAIDELNRHKHLAELSGQIDRVEI